MRSLLFFCCRIADNHGFLVEGETVRYPGWKAKSRLALKTVAGWISFWIALVVGVLVHTGLITGFTKLNPYVRSRLDFIRPTMSSHTS